MIRYFIWILGFSVLFSMFLSFTLYGETIDTQKQHMRERDRELLQIEKKRRNLEEDGSICIGERDECERKLRLLDTDIYRLSQKIEHTKQCRAQLYESAKGYQEKMRERMKEVYLQKDIAYLTKSRSMADFILRLDAVHQAKREDKKRIRILKDNAICLRKLEKKLASQRNLCVLKKNMAKDMLRTLQHHIEKHRFKEKVLATRVAYLEEENTKEQIKIFHLIQSVLERDKAKDTKQSVSMPGGLFCWPVDGGVVTSTFGSRFDPILRATRYHRGIDIGGPLGTPVKAAEAGRVIESRPSNGYGYIVVLYHRSGLSTLYAHMYGWTVTVRVGDVVHKGQVIAQVGSNGWSTGPHLHFEVIEGGQATNPLTYFERKG